MNSRFFLLGLFAFSILTSCSSYLTSSENVSKQKNAYNKILVVGRSNDNTARIKFENTVVSKLAENGVEATASYQLKDILDINKKYSESELGALKKKLMTNSYDGAVITNLINTEEYTDVIPGNSSTTFMPARFGYFGSYLTYYPITTWQPDQLQSGTKYIFESSLYQLTEGTGENLQWVGRFEIKDPMNLDKTAEIYARDLTKALLKSSITNQ